MLRRIHAVLVVLAMFSLLFVGGLPAHSELASKPLSDSLAATGAHIREINVNGWSRLPTHPETEPELRETVCRVMNQLTGGQEYQVTTHNDQERLVVRAFITKDSGQVNVTMHTMKQHQDTVVFVVVNILTTKQWDNLENWQNKAGQIIKDIGGSPRISTCLVGWLDGKLEEDEWKKRLHTALNALDATVVSVLNEPALSSVAGYSPLLPGWLTVENRRVNVNLAMRYSPYDNRTYITIGSPVITREY